MTAYRLVERRRGSEVLMRTWHGPHWLASEASALLSKVRSGRPELDRHHPPTFLHVEPMCPREIPVMHQPSTFDIRPGVSL